MLAMWQSHAESGQSDAHDVHDDALHSAQGADDSSHAADAHAGAHTDEHAGGHDADHGAGHEAEHHHGPKVPELPNLLGVVHNYAYLVETKPEYASQKNPFTGTVMQVDHFAKGLGLDDSNGDHFTAFETIIFGLVVVIALCAFFIGASRQLKVKAEKGQKLNGKAMFTEIIYTFLEDFFAGIVGRDSVRKHLPLIGTLFIYILCCNTFGLLWLGKAPTANLSFNLAMAAIVFFYVHGTAIMKSPAGWLAHFPGSLPSPKEMGGLAYVLAPILAVLFTVIHIMELFIQPASLALRLYGNVLGKDVLLGVFGGLIPYFPTHAPFLFLGLLLGAIQALIFSLLSAVYILMWEPHEHHHDDHHEHAGAHA